MTIETEINRIKQNIANCYTTLTAKGATIPAVENVDNLAACIRTIPTTATDNFATQSGDTIVTSAGTPLAIDGISSLTTAPSITDAQLTFADDGNSTVSFSMQQLKDYVSPAPAATVLHWLDRVDNKATVATFWRDGNGQLYVVCVVDAAYRTGHQLWSSGSQSSEIYYQNDTEALAAGKTATYIDNLMLNKYNATDIPAFNVAHNACTVTVDNKTFRSCLPNVRELQLIYAYRERLDPLDPTLENYPNNSLTTWNIGGNSNSGCWSSTEKDEGHPYYYWKNSSGSSIMSEAWGYLNYKGIIPVIEIPVDENGTVITI